MANGRWEVAPQVDGVDSVDGVEAEAANGRVVYRVNKVKRILRPSRETISRAKLRDQATRQTHGSARASAQHGLRIHHRQYLR